MTMRHMKFIHIVKSRLLAGEVLDTASEITEGRGWRLAALVHYLRDLGWPIKSYRGKNRAAYYYVPPGWEPSDEPKNGAKRRQRMARD